MKQQQHSDVTPEANRELLLVCSIALPLSPLNVPFSTIVVVRLAGVHSTAIVACLTKRSGTSGAKAVPQPLPSCQRDHTGLIGLQARQHRASSEPGILFSFGSAQVLREIAPLKLISFKY